MSETQNGGKGALTPKKIVVGALVLLVMIWIVWMVLAMFGGGDPAPEGVSTTAGEEPLRNATPPKPKTESEKRREPGVTGAKTPKKPATTAKPAFTLPRKPAEDTTRKSAADKRSVQPLRIPGLKRGVAFVEAAVQPLDNELNRFWGWRPNDILNFTDNVNNSQLGVLEVTRRTTVILNERISRTGSNDPYVPALETAMNWFMIKPTNYMFPSAEAKYSEGLDELKNYRRMLEKGEAKFYVRVDNLVPLLVSYESILGSCTENLLKRKDVTFFNADDIFYYSRGVARTMRTIMEAVGRDFREAISGAQSDEIFDEIQVSLERASEMSPWIILDAGSDSLLANHRANMAGPLGRARFHINILIGTLTGNL